MGGIQDTLKDRVRHDALRHEDIVRVLRAEFCGPLPDRPFLGIRSNDHEARGDLFVAVRGEHYDSHRSIPHLQGNGVLGVVAETSPPPGCSLPYYRVPDSRKALALLEQMAAGDPARCLRVLGVTGTNGKSTTVRLLASILEAAGRRVGWMGTVSRRLGSRELDSRMTTPEPRELALGMAELLQAGGEDLILEVSSHALDQRRVAGIAFAGAILTNLSHDHLDYHGTRHAYLEAKMDLFRALSPGSAAVLPARGPVGADHPALEGCRTLFFGEDSRAAASVEEARFSIDGIAARVLLLGEPLEVHSRLSGRHNLRNILAAALLARAVGVAPDSIQEGVWRAPPVRGRLEAVPAPVGRVYVDYAHTPDALREVLGALREFTKGRLLVVFGCGGDRDRAKRPEMGAIAEARSDLVVVTSDNPRGEDPGRIIDDILAGMKAPHLAIVEPDRRRAIRRAVGELRGDDVLVVAGKGHEHDQLIAGERLPFDDRRVVLECLEGEAGE